MKSVVTISRYWNNPQIKTTIDDNEINVSIDLMDFLFAVKREIGSVTTILTKDAFSKRFDNSVARVIEGIKEETIKVV